MEHTVQKDTEIDFQILSYNIMGRQRGNSKGCERFQGKFWLQYQRETTWGSHGRIRALRAEDNLFLYLLRMEEIDSKCLKPGSVTARQKEEEEGVEKRMWLHPSGPTHIPCEMSHVAHNSGPIAYVSVSVRRGRAEVVF